MSIKNTKTNILEKLIEKDHRIFVDTCSLMHPKAKTFFIDTISYFLQKNNNRLFIPIEVIRELNKNLLTRDPIKKHNAKTGKMVINRLRELKLTEERGEKDDGFVDNLFQVLFTKFRMRYNLCLITQDVGLANDILKLNRSRSVRKEDDSDKKIHGYKKDIKVIKIQKNGTAAEFHLTKRGISIKRISPIDNKASAIFRKSRIVIDLNASKLLAISQIPEIKDCVLDDKGRVFRLVYKLAQGGEGRIYTTNSNYVCKVYKKSKINELRIKKLQLMVSKQIKGQDICWPRSVAYNEKKELIGYLMDEAQGRSLQTTIFTPPLFKKHLPDWTRTELVALCSGILDKIEILHNNNVIIGDLNPMNILVMPNAQSYFVDTDSYQVEQFPCPVGQINFTAPEIQGKDFKTFLRTPENDHFALATLLFMILMPGKAPYSHQGGSDPASNIKKKNFPYPFQYEDKEGKEHLDFKWEAPLGQWRFIWSHFPYSVKKAFYSTFKKSDRINIQDWKKIMNQYKFMLSEGYTTDEIFPKSYREVSHYEETAFPKKIEGV